MVWWKVDPVGSLCRLDCGALEDGPVGSLYVTEDGMSMDVLPGESDVEGDQEGSGSGTEDEQ